MGGPARYVSCGSQQHHLTRISDSLMCQTASESQTPGINARTSQIFPHFTIHCARFTARRAAEKTAPLLWYVRNKEAPSILYERIFVIVYGRSRSSYVANRNSARATGGAPDKLLGVSATLSRRTRNHGGPDADRNHLPYAPRPASESTGLTPSFQRSGW